MSVWPEVITAKKENRHEIKLSGAAISKRIADDGLDKTIFQLTNINLLNISETCLSAVPDDIKLLVNLQSLLLFGNKIAEFNENITSLPKLKVLDLSRNLIKSIPESLNKMKELTSINFSSNQIVELPKLMDFPNLIILNVSNNKMKSFMDITESNLPHLSDLNLKGNEIDTIPACIARSLPSVKNFDIGDNQLKTVPGELANMAKLKDVNLKGNKLSDKRLMKLVDQCRTKQILDYVRDHCPKMESGQAHQPSGKKGKKGKNKQEEEPEDDSVSELCHSMKILHVEENVPNVKIIEPLVSSIRPYILCCIVKDLNFDDASFKKFIQMQTRLHDTICDKRNYATIATHDLNKISPGDLVYTARAPTELKITPLMRQKAYTGEQLYQQLAAEAEALRKEKKRNVYSGIHKYLYLLEGKPKYACLEDSSGKTISFPPITNSDETKMSFETKSMLIEVTSHASLGACKAVMDKLLHELLLLGVGDEIGSSNTSYHTLTIQQVKVVDPEGNLKNVYPSRTDCVYEGIPNIKAIRVVSILCYCDANRLVFTAIQKFCAMYTSQNTALIGRACRSTVYRQSGRPPVVMYLRTRGGIKLKFISNTKSTVPWSYEKTKLLSQRNQKIQPFMSQIFHTQGNQNLQGTSRELRILKFGMKQRLIVQIKEKLRKP
ncbi:Leucine-rich repeat-containing protein 47 [Eumeta japonica]|uniref:Leucine-rich repeat-containing protein 47 n=1 Tax=Eumeta variegata TaxID=151549 RepID=A0A4C1ZLH6_EUMVA|nr:Leucine-rich repeat-containing protein 47 [Eumeta japonica]